MLNIIIILIVYFIGCVLAYGILFAHFQRNWPLIAVEYYTKDIIISVSLSVFSWLSVLIFIIFTGFCEHGLKFK